MAQETGLRLNGLDGRTAFITGASRGIGRRIAETLRDQGVNVVAADLSAPEIDGVTGLEIDVTVEESVRNAFETAAGATGGIDILVCNAGVYLLAPLTSMPFEDWQRVIEVNLTGSFLCVQHAVPPMVERGFGRVVFIGSSAGKSGGAKSAGAYAASKAGVMTLAKSLARECAGSGVTSNAVAPALIDTPMIADVRDELAGQIPVGRLGRPEDVADLVAFLASDHGSYLTGEVVDVNGGFLID